MENKLQYYRTLADRDNKGLLMYIHYSIYDFNGKDHLL